MRDGWGSIQFAWDFAIIWRCGVGTGTVFLNLRARHMQLLVFEDEGIFEIGGLNVFPVFLIDMLDGLFLPTIFSLPLFQVDDIKPFDTASELYVFCFRVFGIVDCLLVQYALHDIVYGHVHSAGHLTAKR